MRCRPNLSTYYMLSEALTRLVYYPSLTVTLLMFLVWIVSHQDCPSWMLVELDTTRSIKMQPIGDIWNAIRTHNLIDTCCWPSNFKKRDTRYSKSLSYYSRSSRRLLPTGVSSVVSSAAFGLSQACLTMGLMKRNFEPFQSSMKWLEQSQRITTNQSSSSDEMFIHLEQPKLYSASPSVQYYLLIVNHDVIN